MPSEEDRVSSRLVPPLISSPQKLHLNLYNEDYIKVARNLIYINEEATYIE